ncbi:tetratricopeptide repeat protein [Azoarcus sp. KH32C]|uniref:tetratricopeptide repeat protein n=1 Tax=Azoarcus sp. KH32C TaxID=748247 RepID=UPI00023869F2|nr:hypothetical protein [Azoarcus sp. KH32C]BAL22700.1 hypothetical protein AZKH_0354 [Azoarcus sp. KH32C]
MHSQLISQRLQVDKAVSSSNPPWWWGAVACVALSLAVIVTYHGMERNGFHFDDWPNILQLQAIKLSTLSLSGLIEAGRHAFLPLRPLPSITFALDWWRGNGAAAPFLVTNLALHVLTTCAVWSLLRQVQLMANGGSLPPPPLLAAAGATLWWALQPIHVQAVSYIVQRMTILAALFTLTAATSYLKARGNTRQPFLWLACSVISLLLAATSKENAWIAPLLLLMTEFLIVRSDGPLIRSRFDRALIALPLVGTLFILIDLLAQGPISHWALRGYETRSFTLGDRLLTQPKVVLFHISQLLWPLPDRFSLEHDVQIVHSAASLAFWLPALVITAWCGVALKLAYGRMHRISAFWMLWIPATLVIESSFVPLEMVFEHRMYLPSVGFAGLVAQGLARTGSWHPRGRAVAWTVLATFALLSMWSTNERIPQWRTETTLYEQAVKVAPHSARAWNYLGISLLSQRRNEQVSPEHYAQALDAFSRAIELDARYAAPWTNRGVAHWVHGEADAAQHDLETAISLSDKDSAAFHYLFEIYQAAGRPEDARWARHRACFLGVRNDCYR